MTADMPADMQAGFAAALLDPDRPVPPGLRAWNGSDPARRFGVYRNNVIVSLVGALADTFPVVRQLVGSEFFDAMAGVYVRAHPPASAVLAHYGDGFADWLAGFAPARGLPCLPDMARLERARVAAYHAADAEPVTPASIAAHLARPALLPAARLRLHPSCRVLRSNFAVHALWAAHQRDDAFGGDGPAIDIDTACAMLVLRDAADEVLVVGIDAGAAGFIGALLEGRRLGDALQQAPGVDLAGTLALLLRHGAVVAWHADGADA
ncbi:MAG TPA: DNA-binding domain-containing protein [Rubrivivax sp.]|nr:DNA-binding domain-containing protein [Rubrivivax sp.]